MHKYKVAFAIAMMFQAFFWCHGAKAQGNMASASFVCMRPSLGASDGSLSLIILPTESAPEMSQRGFVSQDCEHNADAVRDFTTKVCELAEKAPLEFSEKFEKDNNVSVEEICTFAKKVQIVMEHESQ